MTLRIAPKQLSKQLFESLNLDFKLIYFSNRSVLTLNVVLHPNPRLIALLGKEVIIPLQKQYQRQIISDIKAVLLLNPEVWHEKKLKFHFGLRRPHFTLTLVRGRLEENGKERGWRTVELFKQLQTENEYPTLINFKISIRESTYKAKDFVWGLRTTEKRLAHLTKILVVQEGEI
jgi:hypothetical protein